VPPTTTGDGTSTVTYTAEPAPASAPRPQDPAEVIRDVKALWHRPHATRLDRADGTTPRMRAALRVIRSFVSTKVMPDKRAAAALLGTPDRGRTRTVWRYLVSIRHPSALDTCVRVLEVEFLRDGTLSGLTMDGDEHCLSD
jgi:hypothetical protein